MAARKKHRIVIVDDHPLVRRGLAGLISEHSDLQLVAEADNADEAFLLIKQESPHLVIVDLSLAGRSGLDLIKQVHAHDSTVRMLVVSIYDETLFAQRCVRAGAAGYLNKESANECVVEAIRHVLTGEIWLSPEMTRRVVQNLAGGKSSGDPPIAALTDRELEVFGLIGHGNTTREISERLTLSVKTIETYREHIKEKLTLSTSAELARHAVQWVLENG